MVSVLPDAPNGSELKRWAEDGFRHEPHGSNFVLFHSPNEEYGLRVEVEDPVHGYLLQLWALERERDEPIARTIVDDRETAHQVAAEMAASADDLDALVDRPNIGPKEIHREDVERQNIEVPDEWEGDDEEWEEAVEEAFEKADIKRSKASRVTKTINDNEYYYLQWREGDTVQSQYIGPVNPA